MFRLIAEAEKNKDNDGQSEGRPGRMRSLSDILYRSEVNSEGPRSEREDSDYEAEMELDFEVPGDEANDIDSGPHINLRFRRRSDLAREASCTNGSCESTSSSSSQNDNTAYQVIYIFTNDQKSINSFIGC